MNEHLLNGVGLFHPRSSYKCARISISPVVDSVVVQPDIVTIVTKSFWLAFVPPPSEYDTSLFIGWPLLVIVCVDCENNRSMSCKSVLLVFSSFDWVVVVVVGNVADMDCDCDEDCFVISSGNTPARIPVVRFSSTQFGTIFVWLLLLKLLLLAIVSPTVILFVSGTIEFLFWSCCCCCCCCNCICCWCRWFADVIIARVSVVVVPMFGESLILCIVDVLWLPLWLLVLLFGVSAVVWWWWPLPLLLPLIIFGKRSKLCRAR